MSTFVFKAMDLAGAPMRGQVDADSKQAVSDQLRARGLVDPRHRREAQLTRDQRRTVRADHAQRPRDLLAPALDDGVLRHDDPAGAVRARGADRGREAQRSHRRRAQGRRGRPRASALALARHPKVFSPLFVSMIRAGEIGGVLEDSLERIANQLEKEDALQRQVRSAMVYPAVVVSVAIDVMIVLVVFIVPVFAGVLKQFATTASACAATDDDPDDGRLLPRDHRLLVRLPRLCRRRHRLQLPSLEELRERPPAVGRACACASPSRSATSSRRSRSRAGRGHSRR